MTTEAARLGDREALRLAKMIFAGQDLTVEQLTNAAGYAVGKNMTEAVQVFANIKKMREAAKGK